MRELRACVMLPPMSTPSNGHERGKYGRYTTADRETAFQRWCQGESFDDIRATMGMRRATLSKWKLEDEWEKRRAVIVQQTRAAVDRTTAREIVAAVDKHKRLAAAILERVFELLADGPDAKELDQIAKAARVGVQLERQAYRLPTDGADAETQPGGVNVTVTVKGDDDLEYIKQAAGPLN